jgi:hypothetical protein
MPEPLNAELVFHLLEKAEQIPARRWIDVRGDKRGEFSGFKLEEVNRAIRLLDEQGLLIAQNDRQSGGDAWSFDGLTADGHQELQRRREDRAGLAAPAASCARRRLGRLHWTAWFGFLIAFSGGVLAGAIVVYLALWLFPGIRGTLRDERAELRQMGAQGVDQARALAHQQVARPMNQQQRLLILALDRNEAIRGASLPRKGPQRPPCRSSDAAHTP